MSGAKKEEDKFQFEPALKRLEEVVERLEKPDVPLDEAIGLYERGMEDFHRCRGQLKEAEQKIKIIRDKFQEMDEED